MSHGQYFLHSLAGMGSLLGTTLNYRRDPYVDCSGFLHKADLDTKNPNAKAYIAISFFFFITLIQIHNPTKTLLRIPEISLILTVAHMSHSLNSKYPP